MACVARVTGWIALLRYPLFNVLDQLTSEQLRELAKSYRATAAQNADYPETCASYLRLAERYQEMADEREAAERAGKGRHWPLGRYKPE